MGRGEGAGPPVPCLLSLVVLTKQCNFFSFISQSIRHLKAFRNADQVKTTLVRVRPKTF